MNLTSKSTIKHLLKKYQLRPSKRLGQNFLIDNKAIRKIVEAANLRKDDIVLEIGPAIGNLTYKLAGKAKKVIAVEKDPKMMEILREVLKDYPNIKIVLGDILRFQNSKLKINPPGSSSLRSAQQNSKYKVVANLPFYITAPVIRKFLEMQKRPKEMILVVQKEVAQRICAKPPKMNLLAVSVQFYAKTEIISCISKKSFFPQPKVDGAILRIVPLTIIKRVISTASFFKIVKAGFSQPRKQLVNNLSKGLKLNKERVKSWLLENNIQPNQRAETLEIEDWIKLTKTF